MEEYKVKRPGEDSVIYRIKVGSLFCTETTSIILFEKKILEYKLVIDIKHVKNSRGEPFRIIDWLAWNNDNKTLLLQEVNYSHHSYSDKTLYSSVINFTQLA